MSTRRIYRENQYAQTAETRVTAVTERDGCDVITTEASVFFPEGGGQPSDTGAVNSDKGKFDIKHAFDESLEGDVWHITDAPAGTFSVGDEVVLTIDWYWRFRNMQRHLGEHMLSGTMHTLFGGVNRGFHMGEEYITIDIDLDGRMLSEDELGTAARTVNDAIWADLPVAITWFDDYESSLALPVRKQVPHDGRVSVVTVGDAGDPYDCIACCGTHPSRSSEVGLLAIYKCEPNKGMNRIYFDCGVAAWEKLTADSALLADIAKERSCSPADLAGRLSLEAENTSALKARLAAMSAYIKEAEKERISAAIAALAGTEPAADHAGTEPAATPAAPLAYIYESEILSVDDTLKLGFAVVNETPDLLLLLKHADSRTCLLVSSSASAKCGALVKQLAPHHNGKGGGRDDNARAIFASAADMNSFAKEVIEKATENPSR